MTTEFLLYAVLVLGLRLRLLLPDGPVPWAAWGAKSLVEIAALGLCAPHPFLLGAATTALAVNAGTAVLDRTGAERQGFRLLLGLLHLGALSFWFSAGGARFRPEFVTWGERVWSWTALGPDLHRMVTPRGLRVMFGLLLAASEANLLVRWLLVRLQIKPGTPSLLGTRIDANEFNRGRVIGLLERSLIYFFVLGGQYGAIGFTLAAKGFTRFKELEDRGFAEYVLVGTLLSSSIAIAIGAWVKAGL